MQACISALPVPTMTRRKQPQEGKKRKVNFWLRADDAVDRVEIIQEK